MYREQTLERQKKLGVVPPDTELTERPDLFPAWDSPQRRAEEAVRAPDGGLRRLLRERRLERRPPARRRRRARRARQHARHLHLGRQRRQHGGHAHRLVQRDDLLQRRRARGRRAARDHRPGTAASRSWAASTRPRTSPPRGRTPTTRRSSGASRWPATWAATWTRWSSRGRATSSPTRPCAPSSRTASMSSRPSSRLAGIPEPTNVDGIEQEPMDGTSFAVHVRRRHGGGAAHRPVLRDVRQPRHLQGRLVGLRQARQDPVGLHARDAPEVRPGRELGPGARPAGSSTTCPTTSARRTTSPPRTRRSSSSSSSSSGRRPSATACCRCSAATSCSSACCRRCRRSTRIDFAGDVQNIQTTHDPAHHRAARTRSRPT